VLTIEHGREIQITEDDVQVCFNFPRGHKKLKRRNFSDNKENVLSWRQHLGVDERDWDSRPLEVVSQMMFVDENLQMLPDDEESIARKERYAKDDRLFIRDFIALVYACLIEPALSGAFNQNLILGLDEVEKISEFNWCDFILSCLNDAMDKWKSPTSIFAGPLMFLVVRAII